MSRKPGLRGLIIISALFSSVCSSQSVLAEREPFKDATERSIPTPLAALICERPINSVDLASYGLYDAQVGVVSIRPKTPNSKLTSQSVHKRGLELAKSGQQLGFSSGLCSENQGWVMTFPAPEPLSIKESVLNIPKSSINICVKESLRVLYAPEQRGRSFLVPLHNDLKVSLPTAKGYVSVICTPKQFAISGPREWALIVLHGAKANPSDLVPLAGFADQDSFFNWINQKRRVENLPHFKIDGELTAAAKSLASRKAIYHDMISLGGIKKHLETKGIKLTSENRVQGASLAEAAGLLWMSPSHRDLLLSPTADSLGVLIEVTESGVFIVMVAGQKIPGFMAKK